MTKTNKTVQIQRAAKKMLGAATRNLIRAATARGITIPRIDSRSTYRPYIGAFGACKRAGALDLAESFAALDRLHRKLPQSRDDVVINGGYTARSWGRQLRTAARRAV